MIVLLAIILAATCNAVMDTLAHHYGTSIFESLSVHYWYPNMSWNNKYKNKNVSEGLRFKFPFAWMANFLDGWHLFKMLMIIFIFIAIMFYKPHFHWAIEGAIFYIAWNGTFELFYQKIFIK